MSILNKQPLPIKELYCKNLNVFCTPVLFNKDTEIIVSTKDSYLERWNITTGTLLHRFKSGHSNPVTNIAISSNENLLATSSEDDLVIIRNTNNWKKCTPHLDFKGEEALSLEFSPNGKEILTGDTECTLKIWNTSTGRLLYNPFHAHNQWIFSATYSKDGKTILSGSDDSQIKLWDVNTCKQIGNTMTGHTETIFKVCFSPSNREVISCSTDGTIRTWDRRTGLPIGNPLIPDKSTSLEYPIFVLPDHYQELISTSKETVLQRWNYITGEPIGQPVNNNSVVVSLLYSNCSDTLVSTGNDSILRFWKFYESTNKSKNYIKESKHIGFEI